MDVNDFGLRQFEMMSNTMPGIPRCWLRRSRQRHKGDWENDVKAGVEYSQDTRRVDKAQLNNDYNRFANLLGRRELAKLEKAGIDYRLPIPGGRIEAGKLMMNSAYIVGAILNRWTRVENLYR